MEPSLKTSPYKCQQLHITFGENKEVYYVPRVFLQDQDWYSSDGIDCACKYSEEVGHVLIHFLFTGKYQALETNGTKNPEVKKLAHLKIALGVLLATNGWTLPALRVLAKSEIESLSKSVHVFELLRLADETIQDINRDIKTEEWLQDFLAMSLNKALQSSHTEFDDFSSFDNLQDKELIRFLAKNLINTCHFRSSKTNERGSQVRVTESPETGSLSALSLMPDTLSSDEFEILSETRF